MVTYSKPSIGHREMLTHRLIHYLRNGTSPKYPDWRDATICFLDDLLSLAEDCPWINIVIHRADGVRIYSGSSLVVFLHIRQRHILAHANRNYLLWKSGDKFLTTRHKGSHDRMWRITNREELIKLISYLRDLPRPKNEGKQSKSRTVPTWVQEFVLQRDMRKCVSCGATENLCFDHIIPYSRGGASDNAHNIQLLCSSCNLKKRDNLCDFIVG